PCQDSHDASVLTTSPNPMTLPATIRPTGTHRITPYRPEEANSSASAYGRRRSRMSASITPHQAEIGTPSVIRNPSNGPMKFDEKNTTEIVPTIISTPSNRAADQR